ncbi:NmrA family NAD(P)-binding protein [Microbacterium sp. STN6]|uniref:SDR family oxidoreductase n=1 Tax=Microbacterium sp. STN6 TaxID=2995588 RepID=UPI0022608D35|nr:NmrA family NAD(P)-binding protein [Microbacterium sp. STN6]MCX7522469.1 NmrA family NAD(P)-binding protein [Microbacterium sp. STN6]
MKVLAVGAAGTSAGLVTRALAAQGVEVRGLVHSAAREAAARANGATETVVADLDSREELAAALDGVDAVFHVVPAFVPDEAATGLVMVEAARKAGVRRLVFSSVYHPSLLTLSNHRDKQPVEQAIYDSGLEFTVLQPAMFMSQLDGIAASAIEHGVIAGPYSSESKMAYVDYRDVAEAAAQALTTDRLLGGTFELAGAGEYSRHEIARELSSLLGRPLRAEGAEPAELDPRMPAHLREGLATMFHHYEVAGLRGGNSLVLDTILQRPAATVPTYLRELVARA